MSDQFTYELKRLLAAFQRALAERDALRIKSTTEASGYNANWETILRASQTKAQELFQPALLALDNGDPPTLVLEKLLELLEGPRK